MKINSNVTELLVTVIGFLTYCCMVVLTNSDLFTMSFIIGGICYLVIMILYLFIKESKN